MAFRNVCLGLLLAGLCVACTGSTRAPMSRERMESLIAESSSDYEGSPGAVQFTFDGVGMACISDTGHDRMRIVAPITARTELDLMLIANYHSSLDARYSVSQGIVYSAFLHPLSSLTEGQLASALRQVATLAKTFGSTYSSGELMFGAPKGQSL